VDSLNFPSADNIRFSIAFYKTQEVTAMNDIDRSYVEKKVRDWKDRLESLYLLVEDTLSGRENIVCSRKRHTTMYEGLMHKYNVEAEELPVLDIYKDKVMIATFEPIGLWTTGGDGRIDILTKSGAYIIAGTGEKGKKSEWEVFTPKDRRSARNMDSSLIMDLVSQP